MPCDVIFVGIIYDVIVEPPSVGSTTDEFGHSKPVSLQFFPLQYNILELFFTLFTDSLKTNIRRRAFFPQFYHTKNGKSSINPLNANPNTP